MATLKEQIKQALNTKEENFSNHCSNLYILYAKSIHTWLKDNYEFFNNVTVRHSNVRGQSWYGKAYIEIPFAYMEEYITNRKKHIKGQD